jgi:hypothetical protein
VGQKLFILFHQIGLYDAESKFSCFKTYLEIFKQLLSEGLFRLRATKKKHLQHAVEMFFFHIILEIHRKQPSCFCIDAFYLKKLNFSFLKEKKKQS